MQSLKLGPSRSGSGLLNLYVFHGFSLLFIDTWDPGKKSFLGTLWGATTFASDWYIYSWLWISPFYFDWRCMISCNRYVSHSSMCFDCLWHGSSAIGCFSTVNLLSSLFWFVMHGRYVWCFVNKEVCWYNMKHISHALHHQNTQTKGIGWWDSAQCKANIQVHHLLRMAWTLKLD